MTDTETHQSDPGLTFGAAYRIEYGRNGNALAGTWRLIRVDNAGRLVFSRLEDSEIMTHSPNAEGFRFVEVR